MPVPAVPAPIRPAVVHSLNGSGGGVPKLPIHEGVVTEAGLAGDRQRNLRYHGGPDRALCLYAIELIDGLRAEGHPIDVGSTGENVTVAGLDWATVGPGVRLALGSVIVEVTAYTQPCRTIGGSFLGRRSGRISQRTNPGWSRVYARVIAGGTLRVGEEVRRL